MDQLDKRSLNPWSEPAKESIWESGLPFQTANVKESQSNGEERKNKKPKEKPGKEKGD